MGNTGKKTKHNINIYQHLYRLNVRCWKYPEKNCSFFPCNFLYMLHKVPMRSGSRIQWAHGFDVHQLGPSWHQQVLSWSPSQGKFCHFFVVHWLLVSTYPNKTMKGLNIAISAESSLNHRNPHGFLWWTSPALITHLGVSEFCHSPIPRPLGSPDISQRGGACTRHEPSGGAGARRLDWRSDHGGLNRHPKQKRGWSDPRKGFIWLYIRYNYTTNMFRNSGWVSTPTSPSENSHGMSVAQNHALLVFMDRHPIFCDETTHGETTHGYFWNHSIPITNIGQIEPSRNL